MQGFVEIVKPDGKRELVTIAMSDSEIAEAVADKMTRNYGAFDLQDFLTRAAARFAQAVDSEMRTRQHAEVLLGELGKR